MTVRLFMAHYLNYQKTVIFFFASRNSKYLLSVIVALSKIGLKHSDCVILRRIYSDDPAQIRGKLPRFTLLQDQLIKVSLCQQFI